MQEAKKQEERSASRVAPAAAATSDGAANLWRSLFRLRCTGGASREVDGRLPLRSRAKTNGVLLIKVSEASPRRSHHHLAAAPFGRAAEKYAFTVRGAPSKASVATKPLAGFQGLEGRAVIIKGIDKVIFAAGSGGNTGPEKTIDVDQEGAKRLIDASKDVEVKKFIMLSSINADNPESSESLRHYLEAKRKADNYLKNSGLNYTIVRPGTLKNEEGTRKIEAALDVEHGEVTRDDVAYTLVHVLNDDVAQNAVFEMVEGEQRIEDAIKEF